MRKIMLPMLVLIMAACDNKDTSTTKIDSKDSSTAKMDYPYTIKNPDQWETGDRTNTMNVLKSLKAYENGNVDEAVSYFGDSVQLRFDGIDAKISKDSLKAMFTQSRGANKSLKVNMYDWESVKSKVNNEQYVTLWYTQIWQDNNGKVDSLSVVNDAKMENGKIVELDEKTRKFPKKM